MSAAEPEIDRLRVNMMMWKIERDAADAAATKALAEARLAQSAYVDAEVAYYAALRQAEVSR